MPNPTRSPIRSLNKNRAKAKSKAARSAAIAKTRPLIQSMDQNQTPAQIRAEFKARAHSLKPIVQLGNKGLTESVIKEIDQALINHELIKIKVSGQDKIAQAATTQTILEKTQAELIQSMGHTLTLYRPKAE